MPYSDNTPERRNLILSSMAVIIYYIGEGKFEIDSKISLPLLQFQFENAAALACLFWLCFFWFVFAYYRTLRMADEKKGEEFRHASKAILKKLGGFKEDLERSSDFYSVHGGWKIKGMTDDKTYILHYVVENDEVIHELSRELSDKLTVKCLTAAWFHYPTRIAYWFPFAIASIALVFGGLLYMRA